MKPPAFQFYPDDFLAGTFHMSQKDVGAYIRLLCVQWNNGAIPCEPEKISRLAGGKVSSEVVAKFTKSEDGLLRNSRLEKERAKQEQYRGLQRDKGIKSAQARAAAVEQRLNHGSVPVGTDSQPAPELRLEPEGNSPSPSPSPSVETPLSPPVGDEALEELRLEVGSWFKRRPNTQWSQRELRALKAVKAGLQDEDVAVMRRRYQSGDKYLRKDILTLLNNWNGELDRAVEMDGRISVPNASHPMTLKEILKHQTG
jgi:uncharacterized protein YdaU (DUF1376 family)